MSSTDKLSNIIQRTASRGDELENLVVPQGNEHVSTSRKQKKFQLETFRLIWGAGGIYAAFLYYGSLMEDVFVYEGAGGERFKYAWFLQSIEAFANVIVGGIGLKVVGGAGKMPQNFFVISGVAQVCAKAFTSLALAHGLSFPIATLAKSAKMAPVMAGSLILGGSVYSLREYLQVVSVILGTVIVSLSKKKGTSGNSSFLGVCFICLSLTMDGVVGGTQKRLKSNMSKIGIEPKSYDFMFYTNLYMMLSGIIISIVLGELQPALVYCATNPKIYDMILRFSICSAIGQSFIFYTVANFDPLVCSTVTTTRKIFSVLISLVFKGHQQGYSAWFGVFVAAMGILSEVHHKYTASTSKR